MQIIYQSEIELKNLSPSVATVGFFDGLHAGHRYLIDELKALAFRQKLKSTVVTFAIHPRKVLNADFQPELLTTLPEKLIQIGSTGIDICVILDFTIEMANLSAFDFLKSILVEKLNVRTLLVGHDHRFGHNRTDGFQDYKQYGKLMNLKVILAENYTTKIDQHISSSKIRQAIQNGDFEIANRLLTYQYSIRGKVIDGFKVGRKIGFPTANIKPEDSEKMIPGLGVYAVYLYWKKRKYKGIMNIGKRPTLDNGEKVSLEVHIIDFDENIYNQTIEIYFFKKLRNEQKFDSVQALIQQIEIDKQTTLSMQF